MYAILRLSFENFIKNLFFFFYSSYIIGRLSQKYICLTYNCKNNAKRKNKFATFQDTDINIVALSIIESSLAFLAQDAFKHHSIQILDLTSNHIEIINVNAFRGLEVKCFLHIEKKKKKQSAQF